MFTHKMKLPRGSRRWMIIAVAILALVGGTDRAQAQWAGTTDIYNTNSGKVGVGTQNPTQKLEVNGGNIKITGGGLFVDNNQAIRAGGGDQSLVYRSSSGGIYYGSGDANDFLVLNGGGAERFRIATNGRIGIGTNNPIAALDVANSVGNLWSHWVHSTASAGQNYGILINAGTNSSDYAFRAQNASGSAELFAVRGDGNVGIGRVDPAYRLDVYGPSGNYPGRVASPDGYLLFGPANTGWSHFTTDRSKFYFNTGVTVDTGIISSYSQDLNLQTSGTTRLTINNSTGNLGVGKAPDLSYKLDVNGEINATGLRINGTPIANSASQWSGSSSISYTGGNVGIGTASPSFLLDAYNSSTAAGYQTIARFLRQRVSGGGAADGLYIQGDGNGTSGSVRLLASGTNSQTLNLNESMWVQNTGNVGIGTASPAANFHVEGSSSVTSRLVSTGDDVSYNRIKGATGDWYAGLFGSPHYTIGDITNSNLAYVTVQKTTGNVGIGTASPGTKLDVNGNVSVRDLVGNGTQHLLLGYLDGAGRMIADLYSQGQVGVLDLSLGNGSVGTRINGYNDSYFNGNVGIGTTSPGEKLTVQGTVGLRSSANSTRMTIAGGESENSISTSGGVPLGVYISGANYFKVNTNGSTRFIITGSGNVGIGKDPSHTLDVAGEINATGLRINGTPIANNASQWSGSNSISYTGGNVGIGTSNPESLLDTYNSTTEVGYQTMARFLRQRVTGGGAMDGLYIQGDGNGTSGSVRLLATGTNSQTLNLNESMWVQNTGNVGIGTTGLDGKLGIVAAANTYALRTSGGNLETYLFHGAGGGIWYTNATNGFTVNNQAGPLAFSANNAEVLRITNSGSVGIGTPSPTAGYKLDVSGDLKISGSGNINAAGTIEAGNIKARYQDVAEWVPSSEQLAPGTVVVLDATKSNQVISSSTSYDTRVAGVISAQPGIALGEQGENKVLVATTGRVKVKVDASKGPIHIGDLLVTSDLPGIAMKSEAVNLGGVQFHRPGTLIGKALEPLEKGKGEILVLLSLQ